MKLIDIIKKLAPPMPARNCTAIILAAGNGSRMGDNAGTKQMMAVGGIPVVVRSIMAFESCKKINSIVVVAKKDEIPLYRELIQNYSLKKVKRIVPGGATRQESVLCGFKTLSDKEDFVAIHDAARCLVTEKNIRDVLYAAEKHGAASAAAPAKDTVKITDEKGFVTSTPDRSLVWYAQTPQIFKSDLYRAAAYYALKNNFNATDDNSLVEYIGARVKMVDCGYENIKITTPEDIHIAEVLLKEREK